MGPALDLEEGLQQLGFHCPAGIERLNFYLDMLLKWNRVYNLTAWRDRPTLITHHILDSLVMEPYLLKAQTILDVGTGSGAPGLILALVDSSRHYTLVDSNQKKTAFLRHVVGHLNLSHVKIVTGRIEDLEEGVFDLITSRAFSSLYDFIKLSIKRLAPTGYYVAMKGEYPEQELAALPPQVVLKHITTVRVPGLDAQRHLITMALA
jgi:16S rRNA (guanine527-N7)-methyltransferase